jgi:hypothetical protein
LFNTFPSDIRGQWYPVELVAIHGSATAPDFHRSSPLSNRRPILLNSAMPSKGFLINFISLHFCFEHMYFHDMKNSKEQENLFQRQFTARNWKEVFIKALKQALKVSWLLLKIYIPVSLLTAVLDRAGVLAYIAPFFEPLMKLVGLPGEAALVFLAAWINNLFAAIAAASVLDLSVRQITIIAIMTGFAHNLIVESGILMKLGMARARIALTRIVFSFLTGMLLHLLMPETIQGMNINPYSGTADFTWFTFIMKLLITAGEIILMMFIIMLLYEILILWKHKSRIQEKLQGVTRFFGMSPAALGPWLVGTFIGIAYGAGILFSMNEKHVLTHKDNSILTLSMCLLHAVVEDTVIFLAIGANIWWILGVRIGLLLLLLGLLSRGNTYKKFTWMGLPKSQFTEDSA